MGAGASRKMLKESVLQTYSMLNILNLRKKKTLVAIIFCWSTDRQKRAILKQMDPYFPKKGFFVLIVIETHILFYPNANKIIPEEISQSINE